MDSETINSPQVINSTPLLDNKAIISDKDLYGQFDNQKSNDIYLRASVQFNDYYDKSNISENVDKNQSKESANFTFLMDSMPNQYQATEKSIVENPKEEMRLFIKDKRLLITVNDFNLISVETCPKEIASTYPKELS